MTEEGAFPNENALLKVLYLRIKELETKWDGGLAYTKLGDGYESATHTRES